MMCDECKTTTATVLVIADINGEKQTKRLCPSCAKRYQQALKENTGINFGMSFGMNDLLSGLLETVKQVPQSEAACSECGMTFARFGEGSVLGCAQCYNVFRPQLKPLLQRIHGSSQHTGKLPCRAGVQLMHKRELEKLKNELNLAISAEEYERAAQIRDKIRGFETEKGGEL